MINYRVFSNFPTFSANVTALELNNEVLIVDLGYYFDELDDYLKDKKVVGVILTHKHFDHSFGLTAFLKKYPNTPVYSYDDGNDYFVDSELNASFMIGGGAIYAKYIPVLPGMMSIGNFNFEIILTPGHTSDSITLYFQDDKLILTGDFLFPTSIGRTDLETGSMKQMQESLTKIKPYLHEDFTMICGHDAPSQVGQVLKMNFYLK